MTTINGDVYVRWIQTLAGLLNPVYPGELRQPLELLLPHLRAEFSAAYLTAESARLVAQAKRFGPVPDWGVVAKALREYIRAVRPVNYGLLPAPREPDHPKPDDVEVERVGDLISGWLAEKAAGTSP
jgi:hypothetical protein